MKIYCKDQKLWNVKKNSTKINYSMIYNYKYRNNKKKIMNK